jgi:nucleoid-associated protein YgaU
MAAKEKESSEASIGPSVVLGLIGAVVVLLLLGAGIWGVGKIISKIRESGEDSTEETVADSDEEEESQQEETQVDEDGEPDDGQQDESQDSQDGDSDESTESDTSQDDGGQEGTNDSDEASTDQQEEDSGTVPVMGRWVANNYVEGDISGDSYAVVWGDTLWEISEARYGSGFEWNRILEANRAEIGFLPNGSQALIVPGQVLVLP